MRLIVAAEVLHASPGVVVVVAAWPRVWPLGARLEGGHGRPCGFHAWVDVIIHGLCARVVCANAKRELAWHRGCFCDWFVHFLLLTFLMNVRRYCTTVCVFGKGLYVVYFFCICVCAFALVCACSVEWRGLV